MSGVRITVASGTIFVISSVAAEYLIDRSGSEYSTKNIVRKGARNLSLLVTCASGVVTFFGVMMFLGFEPK